MAKIYTKGGDKGQTGLVGGQRVPKVDAQIEAYGTIDELNSVLGLAREACRTDDRLSIIDGQLETVQHWLFDLGSLLAAVPEDRVKYKLRPLTAEHVTWQERCIDQATAQLSPLKNFILPAGCEASARLHVARTVARRAERCLLAPGHEVLLPDHALPFINRLSDYLFTMARYANHLTGVDDVAWKAIEPR